MPLPTPKSPAGQSLAIFLLLLGQVFLLHTTGTSQAGELPIERHVLPELSAGAAAKVPVLHSRLTGFPGHSGKFSGLGAGVRILDEEHRTHGMGARFQPFAPAPGALAFEAMHVQHVVGGTGPGQVSGLNNVWSLAANHRMLENRLLLQGEYAVSHQLQGQAGPTGLQGGAAHSLLARYQGAPSRLAGRPSRWGIEFSRAHADAGFWSLANLDHARERVVDRAEGYLGWGSLNARASYSRATGGNAASDPYTETANLTAHFAPGPWWGELGHAYAATYEAGSDTLLNGHDSTSLRLHLPLGERLSLMPEITWGRLEGPSGNDDCNMITGSLGSSATLMHKRLNARVVLLASHQYGEGAVLNTRMVGIESSLSWALRPPRAQAPGIHLSLSGRYQQTETEGAAVQAPADYQAMARVEFSWSSVN